jgi:hypothetical protein
LEAYAEAVRDWNHGRAAPARWGWWSYTVSFRGGMNEGYALTNAFWLAQHLKDIGYNCFFLDAAYYFADGEYVEHVHGGGEQHPLIREKGLSHAGVADKNGPSP